MAHMKALFHYVKMDQFMMFSGSSSGFRVCSCIWLYARLTSKLTMGMLKLFAKILIVHSNRLSGEMNTVHKLYLFMTAYVMYELKMVSPWLTMQNCDISLIWTSLIKIFNYDRKRYFKKMFERLYQAEWKPEFPDRFSEISELVKAVDSLKLEDGKSQGQGSAQKKAHAAAIQAKLLGGNPAGEMSKNALKNKKKKGAEAAASGANNA
ncbi:BnaCnng50300D [Brassica napus]|uniref:BnaCnng50300D protein n=1 Tax=Brassica napus TaxID=3708 RepID=A0A078JLS4_BRANA|nr:BnaCnng50300D [Brassica napus]